MSRMMTYFAMPRWKTGLRLAGLALIFSLCAVAWHSGAVQVLFWPSLVAHAALWAAMVARHPVAAPFTFIGIYLVAVALSLPVGLWLSLLSGLLFGTVLGGVVTVLGASLGAIALFLLARGLLAPFLTARFGRQIAKLQPGLVRDGFACLLAMRLLPVFPFWLVNLAPALIGMRLGTYAAATVLGMLPTSFVLNAVGAGLGKTLAQGRAPNPRMLLAPDILWPLLALAALALMPVIWRQWQGRADARATGRG
ncbi:MAG: VTT domain-containing protein [Acidocella sp.]|nr:VTT domain-containing protein [Acidocella sp.]